MYRIFYECPNCHNAWQEIYSCACDSTCGECDTDDIEALTFEKLENNNEA